MANDRLLFIYRTFVSPSIATVSFAKSLNRSVTGSMVDHIHAAKFMIDDGIALCEIGCRLNETPMSALAGSNGRN